MAGHAKPRAGQRQRTPLSRPVKRATTDAQGGHVNGASSLSHSNRTKAGLTVGAVDQGENGAPAATTSVVIGGPICQGVNYYLPRVVAAAARDTIFLKA